MNRDDPPMPRFGKTALELLDDKYAEPHSLASKYGTRFGLACFGGAMILGDNWSKQRPLKAGLWRYPLAFAAGWAVAEFVVGWRTRYLAERDAVLRQYIQLHPDDFKPIKREKFGSLLLEWVPVR